MRRGGHVRAEVVDRNCDVPLFDAAQGVERPLPVRDDGGFRHLQLQPLRIEAGLEQDILQQFHVSVFR